MSIEDEHELSRGANQAPNPLMTPGLDTELGQSAIEGAQKRPDWFDQAACYERPDLVNVDPRMPDDGRTDELLKLCAQCAVANQCLETGLTRIKAGSVVTYFRFIKVRRTSLPTGMWGGMDSEQRKDLYARRKIFKVEPSIEHQLSNKH
jgi:hypothetical protein